MKDITIPLPNFLEEQIAEVEVKINGKKRKYNYRIESFPWEVDPSISDENTEALTAKIKSLRERIEKWNQNWELIQIFAPGEGAKHIQVLFRERQSI